MKSVGLSFACLCFAGCMASLPSISSNQDAASQVVRAEQPSPSMASSAGSATVSAPGAGESLLLIQMRFVLAEMPRSTAREIFGATDIRGATCGVGLAPDLEALARTHPDIEVFSRPRIIVHSSGEAFVAVSNPGKFVESYRIENGCALPVEGHFEEGFWITAVPRFGVGVNEVEIDLTTRRSVIERPFPEVEVDVPGLAAPAIVQRPKLDSQNATTHVSLALGESYVFSFDPLPSTNPEPRVVVAVMTVARSDG
jgi:hypothetical protein